MENLTKNLVKMITSLSKKKGRDELGLFMAEGPKLVNDLLPVFSCKYLIATAEYLAIHPSSKAESIIQVSEADLKKVSQLCAPQSVVAVFEKQSDKLRWDQLQQSLTLMLDTVQDPGNLGTIIRLADWFGIENVICSHETADVYNPKVVQATMGALARVHVYYTDLCKLLENNTLHLPVYGTFLEGETIYDEPLSDHGIIVMGNEGNGISDELKKFITRKLYIPNFPKDRATSESLNVATATAIVCSEFRRRK